MRSTRWSAVAIASVLLAGSAVPSAAAARDQRSHDWFTAWSRPQSLALAAAADPLDGGRGPGPLVDQSVRNVVRVTASGTALRLRLSNRYGPSLQPDGTTPLRVLAGSVALRAAGPAVVPTSLRTVTFGGRRDVTIAPGATVLSDPVPLPVRAGDDLAASLHVELAAVAPQHGASFVTSYVSPALSGDLTREESGASYVQPTRTTLVLTGVDVRSDHVRGVVATTGGSVTDGHGSRADLHEDFPSWLARRIQVELPAHRRRAVVNNGLGGTTAAAACAVPGTGPSVEERVQHDSLALAGVTHLVVYAGTNDLGSGCGAAQVIAAFRAIARQAHERGVAVLISTVTPRSSYTAVQNDARRTVNAWVRAGGDCSGECDRALDFDAVVRDPLDHDRMDPAIDSGDGVHPDGEGYRRIAASIPLGALD